MIKRFLLFLLHSYKKYISPSLPPSCRFMPTCSEYAMDAVERFGAIRGSILAVWRVIRCNPFSKGGNDPVPDRFFDAFFKRRA